jgi:hypothetical protein
MIQQHSELGNTTMKTTTKANHAELAREFHDKCNAYGWTYSASGDIVTIFKKFTPGDRDAYVECDMFAYGILSIAPLKGGSVWGTDGGSIGGYTGLNGGYYKLNKSGSGGKRFIAELAKLKIAR